MIKRKKIAIGVALVTIGVGMAAANEFIEPRIFGPFHCDACMVEPLMPGPSTEAFLQKLRANLLVQRNRTFTGDKITVCSRGFSTTYTITEMNGFHGGGTLDNRSPINSSRPSGSSVLGGGSNAGGGWAGSVTTGAPTPVPMVPCNLGGAVRMVPAGGATSSTACRDSLHSSST